MIDFLNDTGLSRLLSKIKSAFVAKADTTAVTGVDVDSVPTQNSSNLVTSGGVYGALPTTMAASGSGHKGGLVPDTPSTAGTTKFLREDGTWQEPAGGGGASYTPTLQSAPTSSTTTYTKDGQTVDFEVGQFARVAKQGGGYDFYQLYDLTTSNNVATATWEKVEQVPDNVACISNDSGVGIIPMDGIRGEEVTSSATININPEVVTFITGEIGSNTSIILTVPNDALWHVWDVFLTTAANGGATIVVPTGATLHVPSGYSIASGKTYEIRVIGKGLNYYLAYGEFA